MIKTFKTALLSTLVSTQLMGSENLLPPGGEPFSSLLNPGGEPFSTSAIPLHQIPPVSTVFDSSRHEEDDDTPWAIGALRGVFKAFPLKPLKSEKR